MGLDRILKRPSSDALMGRAWCSPLAIGRGIDMVARDIAGRPPARHLRHPARPTEGGVTDPGRAKTLDEAGDNGEGTERRARPVVAG
jgi:hypothetical protein